MPVGDVGKLFCQPPNLRFGAFKKSGEVPTLVKNIIGGKKNLGVIEPDLPPFEQRRRIGRGLPFADPRGAHVAQKHGDVGKLFCQPPNFRFGAFKKSGFLQQVSRRVTANGELRKDNPVGSALDFSQKFLSFQMSSQIVIATL